MKSKILLTTLLIGILGVFLMENASAQGFNITSASFKNGDTLPNNQVHTMAGTNGKNISPALSWQGAPAGTESFALIAHDPDAPRPTGWYHWIVINIPKTVTSLKEGEKILSPMVEVSNDFGEKPYGGACPPKGHGIHHYNFTIYALNTPKLDLTGISSPSAVENLVKKHSIASAKITATYSRN